MAARVLADRCLWPADSCPLDDSWTELERRVRCLGAGDSAIAADVEHAAERADGRAPSCFRNRGHQAILYVMSWLRL